MAMSRHRPSTDDREHHESRSRAVRGCARLADSGPFNSAIFGVIIANAVVLGLETYPEIDREHGGTLAALNDVCLGIFVVELLIRLIAVGGHPREFLRSGWNVFDVVVIAGAFLPGLRENVTLLRLVRLARIVRVVRLLPDLRVLVLAVGRSLPGIASLMIMGAIAVYVYGMVGWVLFGDALPGEFGTIGDAMLTMFVALTGENIPDLLDRGVDASRWAVPYFISYVLVAGFLLLNILIGVVINSMEEAREIEAARERAERGAAPGDGAGPRERIAALRTALDDLERELAPRS
jgi:voltage-gated sodium channel